MPVPTPATIPELDALMSAPSDGAVEAVRACGGDVAVLGAGGKMGFHLCLMLRRCVEEAGLAGERKVLAVSRFGSATERRKFEEAGFESVAADLSDGEEVAALPEVENVFFLAGVKFGSGSDAELLRRMNVVMPGLVAERYPGARIVALSTGCVYSFTTPESGGATEEGETDPPGEYARSCLGREAVFKAGAAEHRTRVALVRLNYAIDLRYGVLVDIAQKVLAGAPVDVEMGYVNLIWQGDAVDHIVQCLPRASAAPPFVINVTGPEVLRVRDLAIRFGELFGREARILGKEAPTAWLSNAARSHALFGEPRVELEQMMEWVAGWLRRGGETLDKPTHFENREGKY